MKTWRRGGAGRRHERQQPRTGLGPGLDQVHSPGGHGAARARARRRLLSAARAAAPSVCVRDVHAALCEAQTHGVPATGRRMRRARSATVLSRPCSRRRVHAHVCSVRGPWRPSAAPPARACLRAAQVLPPSACRVTRWHMQRKMPREGWDDEQIRFLLRDLGAARAPPAPTHAAHCTPAHARLRARTCSAASPAPRQRRASLPAWGLREELNDTWCCAPRASVCASVPPRPCAPVPLCPRHSLDGQSPLGT